MGGECRIGSRGSSLWRINSGLTLIFGINLRVCFSSSLSKTLYCKEIIEFYHKSLSLLCGEGMDGER